jgi:hypothetical protein
MVNRYNTHIYIRKIKKNSLSILLQVGYYNLSQKYKRLGDGSVPVDQDQHPT